ncbi:MAG: gamma carbonic anhydrase family protein [Candidatus Odinarchaeia archaeon]
MVLRSFMGKTPKIHKNAYVDENAIVIGDVEIGELSSVWPSASLRGDEGKIVVGCFTSIQDNVSVHCDTGGSVKIGDHVTVGHNCIIHGCRIGDYVLVGMGAIIMNDVVIEDNCIIGAGAVVTNNTKIPEGSVVLGVPAKVVRTVKDNDIELIKHSARVYVELCKKYILK